MKIGKIIYYYTNYRSSGQKHFQKKLWGDKELDFACWNVYVFTLIFICVVLEIRCWGVVGVDWKLFVFYMYAR